MKKTIIINPPPQDEKCECCKKHISQLKPFTKGIFKGGLLVKTFRARMRGTSNEQVGASWECRECICLNDEEYEKKRGER